MRVLLVNTYELGHQPVHVASPAARLRRAGHEVEALDLAVEDWDDSRVDRADVIAFSVPMHTAMRLAVDSLEAVRSRRPDVPIGFYGLYAGTARRHVEDRVQMAASGEYEAALVDWVNSVGGAAGPAAAGVVVDTGRRSFDLPDRTVLPSLDRYAALEVDGEMRTAAAVEATHGCRHRCRHCPIPAIYDGRFGLVGGETVLADIDQLVSQGVRHVTFADADFWNGPVYAMNLLREAHAGYPDLTFDATIKVEHLLAHQQLIPDLAAAGVLFVVSAFESANDRILALLDKGHTAHDMSIAVKLIRDAGMAIRPSWLPFTPMTVRRDIIDIFGFLAVHDLFGSTDPIQMAIRLLLPDGSLALGIPEVKRAVSAYDERGLSYSWTSPDPALDRLQERMMWLSEDGAEGDPLTVFAGQWAAAAEVAEVDVSSLRIEAEHVAPRLTEAWFCCAEPTAAQQAVVGPASCCS